MADLDNNDDSSLVQNQVQLLAALRAKDVGTFLQLLQQSSTSADSSCLEAACRDPDGEEFVRLLLQHGADPNSLNPVLQETPLHILAELGNHDTLQVLLQDTRININAVNASEQTALHIVVKKCGEAAKDEVVKYRQCLALLLGWPCNTHSREETVMNLETLQAININASDWVGNTSLHYASQNKDQETILQLLEHGAYIGATNNSRQMPLSGINSQTLRTFLNTCLKMPSDDSVLFNYEFLTPPVDLDSYLIKNDMLSDCDDTNDDVTMKIHSPSPEMQPLVHISQSPELRQLILHPILSSFIQLKWQHTKQFFYVNLIFYFFYIGVLTFVVLLHYVHSHHGDHSFCHPEQDTMMCFFKTLAHALLAICSVCLITKFIFQITVSPTKYLKSKTSYLQFILTLLTILVLFRCWNNKGNPLAAITLFFAWLRLLLLSGEHPLLSVRFHLFRKVCSSFVRYLAWYSFLILAFSLSFHALFHSSKTYIPERSAAVRLFHNPLTSLFTTVGMSAGGFETNFLPFESAAGTSHVIFILFVFFLSLVLLNILTGLAVSQAQEVQHQAELIQLRAKISITSDIETLLLGNPLYIHIKLRRLYISRNSLVTRIIKSSTYLWLLCNWLRFSRNLQKNVVFFSNSKYDHASILFPVGMNSSVLCEYEMDEAMIREAVKIVQDKNGGGSEKLQEKLVECQMMFRAYEQRFSKIEMSLLRSETLQNEILQLLLSASTSEQQES